MAPRDAGFRLHVTAYLLKSGVHPPAALTEQARRNARIFEWREGSLERLHDLDEVIAAATPGDVILVLLARVTGPPAWQRFLEDSFGLDQFAVGVRESVGAVVFAAVDDTRTHDLRWFAWTFGTGSKSLERNSLDPRFGLITALNRIAGSAADGERVALRQLQYRTLGAYSQYTGHRAARDTPIEGFRMARHADFLAGVGGRIGNQNSQVFGTKRLRVRESMATPKDFVVLAEGALRDYAATHYRSDFGFIDDYVPIEDPRVVAMLKSYLFEEVMSGSDSVDVLWPDDLVSFDDERSIQYVAFPGETRRRPHGRVTLTPEALIAFMRAAGVAGLDRNLDFYDAEGDDVGSASVFDCIAASFVVDDRHYACWDGSFYHVAFEFLRRIDNEVGAVPYAALPLPCYMGGTEPDWSRRVAEERSDEYVLLDRSLIRLPGETPFEAADLVHVSGTLLHVKRKGRSSGLSYAMLQARHSSQMLAQSHEACERLRNLIRERSTGSVRKEVLASLKSLDRRPAGLDVAIVLLGDWRHRSVRSLPLLAKIHLVETVSGIGQLGFNAKLATVDLCRTLER